MLTVDLVRCRITKDGTMSLVGRGPKQRPRQLELAQALIEIAERSIGLSRDAFQKEMEGVPTAHNEAKLFGGFKKLLLDHCEFEQSNDLDPEELRAMTWQLSAKAWRALEPHEVFDRQAVLLSLIHI